MCGIFGVINDQTNEAAQTVLTGLKKLEYRGYDSWGIALSTTSGTIQIDKHIGKIGNAKTSLPHGSIAIGHTRWATHGGVTDANAHPHLDCSHHIAVIHNGIVENYQELQAQLKNQKHTFASETDTEIIAHLIEEESKTKPFFTATLHTFKKLVGSNAIAVLNGETGEIVVCRNGSPLVIGVAEKSIYIASDATAFLDKTNTAYFMEDNEAIVIKKNNSVSLYSIPLEKEKRLVLRKIDWKAEAAEKAGYAHFMLKEVNEQAKTIPNTLMSIDKEIEKVAHLIKMGYKPVLIACGSASYCGLAAQYLFASAGIDAINFGAYEFEPFARLVSKKSLVFAISQSGETADTILAIKQAKRNGATIVAVINAQGSTLERLANYCLPVGAGPEIAVVSTKAFTAQLGIFFALISRLSTINSAPFIHDFPLWLKNKKTSETILNLAKQLLKTEHIYLIGKHINYPSALEFALKLKETSYMHAESFASGELKHGVISLIQPGTPCIVLTAHDAIQKEVLSSAIELKSRGAYIVGVGPANNKAFDYFIETPESGAYYSIFYNVVVGQLLGYYLGVGRGADPDKPRNLAKSVTVK